MQPFCISEPKTNLNFYKYNAITRIGSNYNFINFQAHYFGKYDTFRENFDQKIVLFYKQK